ncbi:hypothetical protein GJ744_011505 [Endocarpon pusillum]|uniref:Uncharacterized protein n=1 Tax=Endocarpon pusillum TaxID=364733 RepID=A0A8H7AGK6_9EURO|nr:hypothetical protein GJ744_011505 [Endocarpon pusillum]
MCLNPLGGAKKNTAWKEGHFLFRAPGAAALWNLVHQRRFQTSEPLVTCAEWWWRRNPGISCRTEDDKWSQSGIGHVMSRLRNIVRSTPYTAESVPVVRSVRILGKSLRDRYKVCIAFHWPGPDAWINWERERTVDTQDVPSIV